MFAWLALALLQSVASGAAPAVIDLKCVRTGTPSGALAFHIDLPHETFSVKREDGSSQSGSAESYKNKVVLELPSSNPEAIPMFLIDLDAKTYQEVRRSGASAMTATAEGTCAAATANPS